jgi:carbamoyltransferase
VGNVRILGISPNHDSSVAVYNNGQIEFFAKEERLSGIKRDPLPYKALAEVAKLYKNKIDYSSYCWLPEDCGYFRGFHAYTYKTLGADMVYPTNIFTHHLTHAALAFYNSQFKKALVVVIDHSGSFKGNSREGETIYTAEYPYNFKRIYHKCYKPDEFGIVRAYEAATTLIGQGILESGKTMGLSSYGENLKYEKLFKGTETLHDKFENLNNSHFYKYKPTTPSHEDRSIFKGLKDDIVKQVDPNKYQFYANKAKQVQLETQEACLKLIKKHVRKTGIKNVCIVGGYGLNVLANSLYVKNLPDCSFYFEPVADDSGCSLGAAMLGYRYITKDESIYRVRNNFYHFYEPSTKQHGTPASIKDVCNILNKQKIVALFKGAPEAGPRALGHRSLLFDPRNLQGKKIINSLKKREWYRPFAGVILKEKFNEYFETMGLKESPYMTLSFKCKPNTKKQFPSIVHVDNTCRVQTVSEGFLYDILKVWYKKTGCPMLLNTSFNTAGRPLVQTKEDAVGFTNTVNNPNFEGVYFVDDKKLYKTN